MGLIDYSLLLAGEQINLTQDNTNSIDSNDSFLKSSEKMRRDKKATSATILQSREGALSDMMTQVLLDKTD